MNAVSPLTVCSPMEFIEVIKWAVNLSAPIYAAFLADHYHVKLTENHEHFLPKPDFISAETYYWQGADFFGPPLIAITFGQHLCKKAHQVVDSISNKASQDFRENWRGIRSAITFGLLCGYEGFQSLLPGRNYDFEDVTAYGVGLSLFLHKRDIIQGAKDTVCVMAHHTEKAIRKTFGYREDKLTN